MHVIYLFFVNNKQKYKIECVMGRFFVIPLLDKEDGLCHFGKECQVGRVCVKISQKMNDI
jgi:hypothetical protein